ncbi:hypothetical protein SAMN00120144_2487 [Hymenobacter roseosalivarius DSM 11622]|uniref:Uncharacterized protein n=1 Tax=Hymenobacter roseosalivarius DSM 11622 TaxID=645990 RepID=A0A1W1VEZ9_9BACT|nr:hypothetical protein SAMN00120144_2487 [Hymenobacter roseosalivarius DSM 11622]
MGSNDSQWNFKDARLLLYFAVVTCLLSGIIIGISILSLMKWRIALPVEDIVFGLSSEW